MAASRSIKVLCLSLLVGLSVYNFGYRDGWKDDQDPGDEPAYINAAYEIWHSGAAPDQLTWSPGYEVLMSPFVGLLGKQTGYKVWRCVLFTSFSLMTYLVFSQMFSSLWFGLVLGLWAQLFWEPYQTTSLQLLAAVIYLACLRFIGKDGRHLGLAFALLLNCLLVTGASPFVLFGFGGLCLILFPKRVFSGRVLAQFSIGIAVFAIFLLHYGYSLRTYPQEATQRGRDGLYHQVSLYIWWSGRAAPYYTPEIAKVAKDPGAYHQVYPAIRQYWVEKWGASDQELRTRKHGKGWPDFLLDWPWMMSKDPQLMKAYRIQIFRNLAASIVYSFQVILPVGRYDPDRTSIKKGSFFIPLLLLLMLPRLVRWARGAPDAFAELVWPSSLQILLILSSGLTLLPLMLVNPLWIYFPPFFPAYFMLVGLASAGLLRKIAQKQEAGWNKIFKTPALASDSAVKG